MKRRAFMTLAALTALQCAGATAQEPDTNSVPAALDVPAAQVLVLSARGVGVQIYECAAAKDDPAQFLWTLKAPEAALRDAAGRTVGTHYAGPTWEAPDGSKVVGEVVAKAESPQSAAIPWLLLRAKTASGKGIFSAVVSIQRLRTSGGKAPALGCDAAHSGETTRVPYSADYRFFRSADLSSPAGVWKTFDDKTGNPRAIVRIYEQDGQLFGRIEQTLKPGGENRVCGPCTDERKGKPIVGLVIIRNMKADGNEYDGGDILDPESGSVYRCKMHLEQNGARLVLRGYIGISLLGR